MSTNKRGAGILLHISSLASSFGIGDLGPEAKAFADFLFHSKQHYWQLLPLNPTEQGQGHSPYSSISSMAGNTLLISPELLVADGLIEREDLKEFYLPQTGKIDYAAVELVKEKIYEKAWHNFNERSLKELHDGFYKFCEKESYWLDDFSMYMLLKQQHENKPWYRWSYECKVRDEKALAKVLKENKSKIEKIKLLQFLFNRQWLDLREYCNSRGIKFFGDLPFYISYDSVDVWSHRDIFSLDMEGEMIGVAGVPPDAFSEDGQLWGMPVFLWDVLKEKNYNWWVERFKKNMELFDILRLDHFRAFADYWEVPASSPTAKIGKWKAGPGVHFFESMIKSLGNLPFIAEDLGEINEPVYELRDQFNFSGMKVLQFAFGHEMPQNPYIPHNYSANFVAYTGTHDNNTIRGWYRQEGHKYHHQLERYVGRHLTEDNIHEVMCRLAMASVANIAILPIQDLLGLDEDARMNIPASCKNNWQWRLKPGQITANASKQLEEWTVLYNRS